MIGFGNNKISMLVLKDDEVSAWSKYPVFARIDGIFAKLTQDETN